MRARVPVISAIRNHTVKPASRSAPSRMARAHRAFVRDDNFDVQVHSGRRSRLACLSGRRIRAIKTDIHSSMSVSDEKEANQAASDAVYSSAYGVSHLRIVREPPNVAAKKSMLLRNQ